MSFTVQDIVNRLGDHVGNYSTGQASTDQKIRGIDSAINYLKLRVSFPQDEKKYSFYYTSDNLYWAVPTGFQEAIGLFYNNANFNTPNLGQSWEYRPWEEILVRSGLYPGKRMWGHTTINGSHQLILLGANQLSGQMLQTFDSTLWTASGDANSASTDTNIVFQGIASEKFTITYATGQAILTSPTVFWDFTTFVTKQGFLNLYAYFPSIAVTNVKIQYGSDTSNYYEVAITTNANGTTWDLNQWNKLVFQSQNATVTGSPNKANITFFKVIFTVPNTFGSVPNFHIDNFYTTFPDYLDLVYITNVKGTDSTGVTNKVTLTALSDIINYDYDYIDLIALRAALYIWPQLKGDINFMQLYSADFEAQVRMYARRWPRKRIENNYQRTKLGR